MKSGSFRFTFSFVATVLAGFLSLAATRAVQINDPRIAQVDALLAQTAAGQTQLRLGDMILNVNQIRSYRQRLVEGGRSSFEPMVNHWTNGRIPYVFDGVSTAQQSLFFQATQQWQAVANVQFVPVTLPTNEPNYIHVFSTATPGGDNSTFSVVGMVGGPQDLGLGDWADQWNMTHELGHALGLIHEQSRSDRDNFVTIVTQNIQAGAQNNFDIVPGSINQGDYDLDSIMHYPKDAFSVNGADTIVLKVPYSGRVGQRDHLSVHDKLGMAEVYGIVPGSPTLSGSTGTTTTGTTTTTSTTTGSTTAASTTTGSTNTTTTGTTTSSTTGIVSNDNFANAAIVTGAAGNVIGSNVGATKEPGEPNHGGNPGGASVWYRWTAPGTGVAAFTTASSTFQTLLGVYTGASVSALSPVSTQSSSSGDPLNNPVLAFNATQGSIYYVAVDGVRGASGPATGTLALSWAQVPANDNFANAEVISGPNGTVTGNNELATSEQGEPPHAGNPGGASLWYSWTAPSDGFFTFNTAGSTFDTLLSIYTGSRVDALTTVAENDDESPTILTSKVTFAVTGGTTYYIAVDGFNSGDGITTGSVILNWSPGNAVSPAHVFTAANRWEMVSAPYNFANTFTDVGIFAAVWQPQLNNGQGQYLVSYAPNPQPPADTFHPGQGYWVFLVDDLGITPPPSIGGSPPPFSMQLPTGWNQIGNPFTSAVALSNFSLQNGASTTTPLLSAIASNQVSPLYTYDSTNFQYTALNNAQQSLDVWQGAWIYTFNPVTMVISPPPDSPAPATRAPKPGYPLPASWRHQP